MTAARERLGDWGEEGADARLWADWRASRAQIARERLFAHHYRLALTIAKRHHFEWTGTDLELADLRQAACVGLLEAIDHFEPERGAPFPAYARIRIRGAVLDCASRASDIREQLTARARARRDRLASLKESREAQPKPSDRLAALLALATGLAIGFMLDGSLLYAEENAADPTPNAYESLAWRDMVSKLNQAIADLPERLRFIILSHYRDELSFDELGAVLGLGKARVSQLHKDAVATLRGAFSAGAFASEQF